MKKCIKCNKIKRIGLFYHHSQMRDGHLNKCIDCCIIESNNHRLKNITKIRAYDRKRGNRQTAAYRESTSCKDSMKKGRKKWIENNLEKHKNIQKLNRKKRSELYPEKINAIAAIRSAIKSGKLKRPNNCEKCGTDGVIHGHHLDYRWPLKVIWLCHTCHMKLHTKKNKLKKKKI